MMEVDHVAYIFGSFSRRRQSEDVSAAKRRSLMQGPKTSPPCRLLSADSSSKFLCPRCEREFKEPRVLPCLHTFCTACLQEVYSYQGSGEVLRTGDTGYKTELGITGDTGYKTELGITGDTGIQDRASETSQVCELTTVRTINTGSALSARWLNGTLMLALLYTRC
uniref:RING-type domain-containing protein n=1 Tax=Timema monikensis TaxID=170555 RepID=A0A7R9EK56_9NEOP|nr:unnamed protein product [Timema monikensis]